MREYLTASDITNTVSMLRSAFDGTILVVEGATDLRLYGKFTDPKQVGIVIAHSKDNVKDSVNASVENRRDHKVIGIMDADLDRLKGNTSAGGPLFMTCHRDQECMLMSSEAINDVLWEYADNERRMEFEDRYGPIKDCVFDAAYPLGLLMYVSEKNRLNLCFKDLDFQVFINNRTLRCDVNAMIREVVMNTMNHRFDARTVKNMLSDSMKTQRSPKIVCRGHDLVSVLAIGLRDIFGGYNARYIRDDAVAGALRIAYDERMFVHTKLFNETAKWCKVRNLALWRFTEE